MNTKFLVVLGLVALLLAVWFFRSQGQINAPIQVDGSQVDYEATDIQAVQTNDKGDIEYQLNAKRLSYNPDNQQDELLGIEMTWQPNQQLFYSMTAGMARLDQDTGNIYLGDGFKFMGGDKADNHHQPDKPEVQPNNRPLTIIEGEALQGNTKQHYLYSEKPVTVKQGNQQFHAKTMKVDLAKGDYEFGQVEVVFNP